MFHFVIVLLIISVGVNFALTADIAVFAIVASTSHKNVFKPLVEELFSRGHSVTIFADFPLNDISSGINKVVITDGEDLERSTEAEFFPGGKGMSINTFNDMIGTVTTIRCKKAVEGKELQDILSERKKPDVIIGIHQYGECALAVAHKIQVPFIFLSTTRLMAQFANNMRLPYPSTYVPFFITPFSPNMNFRERLSNMVAIARLTYHREFRLIPKMNEDFRSIFGEDLPSILDMEKNVSLVFVNTHVSVGHPQPYMPQMVEIGGMHVRPGKPLPEDLENWMGDSGPNGVIYFSFGTVLVGSNMQEKHRKIFLRVFSQLPQRIIWKWETGHMADLPDNVRLYEFLPQQDILAHPSTKAFITHGGILSLQETVYHGVPAIGIPGGWDQTSNLKTLANRKAAIILTWDNLTETTLLTAIKAVVHDPSYKQNIQQISRVFKDQPMSPMDTTMYWIEFVIRHKGAGHLRSAALDLKWYQYYALDIVLFLVSTVTFSLWILCCTMRQVFRSIRMKTFRNEKKKKA